MNDVSPADPPRRFRPEVFRLGVLCGTLYFIQGLCEPEYGILSQPVNSLLRLRGYGPAAAGTFAFWLGIPWSLKLLYGMLSDFVPIFGYRRRSWLLLMSVASTASFLILSVFPSLQSTWNGLLGWMLVANLSVAFADVVIDATMVEKGQPLGATGRLQSIQWGAMNASSAIAAFAGGWLSQRSLHHVAFEICAFFSALSIVMVWVGVREERNAIPEQDLKSVFRALTLTARSPVILAVGAFLFLWAFNPFNWLVLYRYFTEHLKFDEATCGNIDTVGYLCAAAASLLYAWYGRLIPFGFQIHLSVVLGVLATVAYWGLGGVQSAFVISGLVAAINMTATVIQLDLAARICPPQLAGTIFSVLMAVSNFGTSAAKSLGGWWFESWSAFWSDRLSPMTFNLVRVGPPIAFNLLVATGAACTAASWLLVPWLVKHDHPVGEDGKESRPLTP